MKLSALILANGLAAVVVAAPSSPYVVHQKRDINIASEWEEQHVNIDRREIFPMSIALTQRNLDKGYSYLMDVSDPESQNYGKHWDADKVADTFAAADGTIDSVISWLADNGIEEGRVVISRGRNVLRMDVTVAEAESLLKTRYKVYGQKQTRERSVACDEYSVPAAVQRHIDYITPTVRSSLADANAKARRNAVGSPMKSTLEQGPPTMGDDGDASQHRPELVTPLASRDAAPAIPNLYAWDLKNCESYMTPACIRYLYNMPNGTLDMSSMAVIEYYEQAYVQRDLEIYLYNFNPQSSYTAAPIVEVMSDAYFNTNNTVNFANYGEGNLDVQLVTALIAPQRLTYYQAKTDDVFLDAIDASYCKVVGGKNCGVFAAASVISISWSALEAPGDEVQIRLCNEYMKLGLMGITVLVSSGDKGVGCNSEKFQPEFPPSCPYVTAVGGTSIPSGGSIDSVEVAASFSGGGFSNQYARPLYQKDAVTSYYANYNPTNVSSMYNPTENTRGYPDLSANGVNMLVILDGKITTAFGTSASAPIAGSLFTLINEQLALAGRPPVGFINPAIYRNPYAFNDITSGSNPNAACKTPGFSAVQGWDPVTGVGAPDYPKLLKLFAG